MTTINYRSTLWIWITILTGLMILVTPVAAEDFESDQELEEATPLIKQPKPEMERPTEWGEPTEVQIGIYIVDIDEVDSAQQKFAASVYYQAQWNGKNQNGRELPSGIYIARLATPEYTKSIKMVLLK